jgi:hypothetical protein
VHTNLTTYQDGPQALSDFTSLFLGPTATRGCGPIEADAMHATARHLLVHSDHMTTRLRDHYGQPIELSVIDHRLDGDWYRRRIILRTATSGRVVEVGLVRINLSYTPEDVRAAIKKRNVPLGDILIGANVLRRIEPLWFFKISPPSPLLTNFSDGCNEAYGRLAAIYCDGVPAVELLEVIRPD